VTVDGTIAPGEYGNTQNGTNQISTNTGQTWYMTWDSSDLYVGVANANLSEGAILYVGTDPSSGLLSGFPYDLTDFSSLPFKANFVAYAKDGYEEYRSVVAGSWSAAVADSFPYASNGSTNVREFAIPWIDITGSGLPSSFDFFGYLTSSGGYVYGQVPNDNPGAFIGSSAQYTNYFEVSTSSANGPFSNEQPSQAVGVPEPSTWTLAIAGVALLGMLRGCRLLPPVTSRTSA
jgi:hypothetical protein